MGCQYRISKFFQVEEEAEDKSEHLRKEIELLENEMNQLPNELVAALQEVKEKERPCQKNTKLSELELELQCCSCQEVCRPPACIYQVKKTRISAKKVTKNQVKKGRLSSNQSKVNVFSNLSLSTMFQVKSCFSVSRGRLNLRTLPPTKGFLFYFFYLFYFFPTKGGPKVNFFSLNLSFSNRLRLQHLLFKVRNPQ